MAETSTESSVPGSGPDMFIVFYVVMVGLAFGIFVALGIASQHTDTKPIPNSLGCFSSKCNETKLKHIAVKSGLPPEALADFQWYPESNEQVEVGNGLYTCFIRSGSVWCNTGAVSAKVVDGHVANLAK